MEFQVIDDETLPGIIEQEVANSLGQFDGQLSESRAREFKYYYGMPFGNEIEGESQVVSTDVADTIEGLLPIILNIFTASDDVVRFDPNGPEDEEQAKQQTEVANYVLTRQNNGFVILYNWFKDAMIQKNGIVKYWWDEKETNEKSEWQGLSEGEYRKLMDPSGYLEIEELEHSTYDDPSALEQIEAMKAQVSAQAQQAGADPAMVLAQIDAQPIPQLHDVKVRIRKDVSKICIEAIPPEEFGVSSRQRCISVQDADFCHHTSAKSISVLRMEGCPEEILAEAAPTQSREPDMSPEALARDRYTDETWRDANQEQTNDPKVWVTDCFIRIDYDGDGVAELRHIIKVGRNIWVNEETDHINFACLTPIIMPHRWIGRSVAELVMDVQFIKSTIMRQQLNNLYLTNNPQKAVLSTSGGIVQANLDDLMSSRPGGILREYVQGAIRNIETPFVAAASFPMIEYLDGMKENRTGLSRYNQGTDADSLNKTARGIQLIQAAGAQRTNLIARVFAETGIKDLMKGIVYMLSKYSTKAMTIQLRNKWVDIDPREWKTQLNMTVNVGLGTGNKDQQLQHLMALHGQQLELMKIGRGYMVSDENLYKTYTRMAEAMGFKHPELFVTDPEKVPPQAKQPRPDPAAMKVQADAQEGQAKLQQNQQKMTVDAKLQEMLAQIAAQTQLSIAQMNNENKVLIEQMRIEAAARMAVFEKNGTESTGLQEMEQKRQETAANLQLEQAKVSAELQLQREKVAAELQLQREQAQAQIDLQREQAAVDAQGQRDKLELERQTTAAKLSMEQQARDSEAKEKKAEKKSEKKESKSPDIHIHMPSGKRVMTLPDGSKATSEDA